MALLDSAAGGLWGVDGMGGDKEVEDGVRGGRREKVLGGARATWPDSGVFCEVLGGGAGGRKEGRDMRG